MGLLTIPMALISALGGLAGLVLLVTGSGAVVASGAILLFGGFVALGVVYRVCEPLARLASRRARSGRTASARGAAIAFGSIPVLALTGLQFAALSFVAKADPSSLLVAGWAYAVATGPATALAAVAGRARGTLWSVRAYAAHLSCWMLLTGQAVRAPAGWALGALMPGVLPVAIGALIALADPRILRTARL